MPGAPPRALRPRRGDGRAAGAERSAAGVRPGRVRGRPARSCSARMSRGRPGRLRRGERRGGARPGPGRPAAHQPRAARGPGRRGLRPAVRRQGARQRARVRDARRRRSCARGAARRSRVPGRCWRARSTSCGCSTSCSGRSRRRSASCRPGVDVEHLRPVPARAGAGRPARGVPARRAVPRRRARPGRRQRSSGCAGFLAGDRRTVLYVGKLSEEKGVALLLEALRGLDARAVVVGFGPARAALERAAGPDVLFHRAAGAPAPGPPVGAGRRQRDAVGLPGGVRDGRGRGGVLRLRAARGPALRAGRDRRGPGGGVPRAPARPGVVRARRRRGPAPQARAPAGPVAGGRGAVSAGARRAAERLWSWQGVAARVLALA